jgi:hypothetical protein
MLLQVVLAMYAFLGSNSFPQLEMILERVLLKLAEGEKRGSDSFSGNRITINFKILSESFF